MAVPPASRPSSSAPSPDTLQFETPENVHVHYTAAGAGTRFLAWFVDQMLILLGIIAAVILLAVAGVSFSVVEDWMNDANRADALGAYVLGFIYLVIGLGSFVYFTVLELFFRGQTLGKRMMGIRVVKGDGFGLDPGSVLIRNLFRVADNLPLLWIVPVMSRRSQRTGDMVAGTLVIQDEPVKFSEIRQILADRNPSEAEFRFDNRSLGRLTEADYEAVEKVLERWTGLPEVQQRTLLDRMVPPLVMKLKVEGPAEDRRVRFLEDLLAAELRRQHRELARGG